MSAPAGPPGGLQPERTALAWSRTAVGLLANGALLVAGRFRTARPGAAEVLAAGALVLALAFGLAARRRSRELRHPDRRVPPAIARRVAVLGAAVVAFCLLTGVDLLVG